jgi:hypothetical protein
MEVWKMYTARLGLATTGCVETTRIFAVVDTAIADPKPSADPMFPTRRCIVSQVLRELRAKIHTLPSLLALPGEPTAMKLPDLPMASARPKRLPAGPGVETAAGKRLLCATLGMYIKDPAALVGVGEGLVEGRLVMGLVV